MEQQLQEFPVVIEETNEVITLLLNSEFLRNLVAKAQGVNNNNIEPVTELEDSTSENSVDKNNADKSKTFVWPDKAVLLLIELYREKEEEFSSGFKRSNKIWAEIAAEMNKANPAYEITVMDSLFGDKASIRPPAIATSDGPSDPNQEGSSLSVISSPTSKSKTFYFCTLVLIIYYSVIIVFVLSITGPPKKRKRMENVMEEFLANIAIEKEEKKEEMKRQKKIRKERRIQRNKRHEDQISVQKSL
ncbi:uncharacterized protein [Temnothorax nylanderi]|uniref:uncharacterized protein n=1 Tax=Temnothorax nylanderi TaxID=102681 RepID=UPI003A894CE0